MRCAALFLLGTDAIAPFSRGRGDRERDRSRDRHRDRDRDRSRDRDRRRSRSRSRDRKRSPSPPPRKREKVSIDDYGGLCSRGEIVLRGRQGCDVMRSGFQSCGVCFAREFWCECDRLSGARNTSAIRKSHAPSLCTCFAQHACMDCTLGK